MLRVGVVGNRIGFSYSYIKRILEKLEIDEKYVLVSGGAVGVDSYAQQYAKEKGCTIIIHYPDLRLPSPECYFLRNKKIVEESDFIVCFDKVQGASGSKNVIAYAKKSNKAVFLYTGDD